jgi:hypothetical protein
VEKCEVYMTDSFGNQDESEKIRLFSKFLRESSSEQSDEPQGVDVESVTIEGCTYILTGNVDGVGPCLLTEVEDIDGFRYFVQRWRIPLGVSDGGSSIEPWEILPGVVPILRNVLRDQGE